MDLRSYTAALTAHLPGRWGTWEVDHQDLARDPDWAYTFSLFVLGPVPPVADLGDAAVLTDPTRPISLLVTRGRQSTEPAFTIRSIALADAGSYIEHAGDGAQLELAVPADPSTAATDIAKHLLPRHDRLVADHRLTVMEGALQGAQLAVDHWDSISDGLSDEQGWPLDDQLYGDGVVRRDAFALAHLQQVLPHVDGLLQNGRTAQASLPPGPAADRANWQLGELEGAFAGVGEILHRWQDILTRTTTVDGYKEALEERNAEAWHDVHTWLSHGPALAALLRDAAEPDGSARRAAAQARSPRQTSGDPAGHAEPPPSATAAKRGAEQRR
ncbi:hypothetical protein [Kitasatospora sp. HPMI-4]|uniref:hypothetical protein n=1 Tax=Kitasatospora sp. HPMI-4 TaxID=3448443 RepID=UPI003F1A09E2